MAIIQIPICKPLVALRQLGFQWRSSAVFHTRHLRHFLYFKIAYHIQLETLTITNGVIISFLHRSHHLNCCSHSSHLPFFTCSRCSQYSRCLHCSLSIGLLCCQLGMASNNIHPLQFLGVFSLHDIHENLTTRSVCFSAPCLLPTSMCDCSMNQRVIQIEFRAGPTVGGLKTATVRMPPAGGLVAPQGMYMMFVLNNDIPCKKAIWIRLTP